MMTTRTTLRLMHDGGISGPQETIDVESRQDILDWVDGQTGHPWDLVTVTPEDGEPYELDLRTMEETR
jgi:hypothetical protein